MALAIDQESRPRDAMVLADSLRNGAHGIDPFPTGAPTANLGSTAATRMLAGREAATAATRIATRTPPEPRTGRRVAAPPAPRPGAPQRRRSAPPGEMPGARRGNRAIRRLLALLAIAILFTAAVGAAVAISTSTSNSVVHFRTVVSHDAQSAIQAVKNLINGNTK